MKKILYLFIILACASCKKDTTPYQNDFDGSYNQLLTFKKSTGNSYSYIAYQYSGGIVGGYAETKISVQNGVIIGRTYTYYGNGGAYLIGTWTEDKTTLNTHREGGEMLTLDDIYSRAKTVWLAADTNIYNITFTTDSNTGMIASCGITAKTCTDPYYCFQGINLKSIVKL